MARPSQYIQLSSATAAPGAAAGVVVPAPASASPSGGRREDPAPADPSPRREAEEGIITPSELNEWMKGTVVDDGDGSESGSSEDVSGVGVGSGGGGGAADANEEIQKEEALGELTTEEPKDGEGGGGYDAAAAVGDARGGNGGRDASANDEGTISNPPAPRRHCHQTNESGGQGPADPSFDDGGASASVARGDGGEGGGGWSATTGAPSRGRPGDWRSAEGDLPARRVMVRYIAALLKFRKRSVGSTPITVRWLSDLPHKSKMLEERLYLTAPSLERYLDRREIKARLGAAARDIAVQHSNEETKKRRRSSRDVGASAASSSVGGGGGKKAKRSAIGGVGGSAGGGARVHPPSFGAGTGNTATSNASNRGGRFDSVGEHILRNIREQKQRLLFSLGRGGGATTAAAGAAHRLLPHQVAHAKNRSRLPGLHVACGMTGLPANDPYTRLKLPVSAETATATRRFSGTAPKRK